MEKVDFKIRYFWVYFGAIWGINFNVLSLRLVSVRLKLGGSQCPPNSQLYLVNPWKLNLYDKRLVIMLRIPPESFHNRKQDPLKRKTLFKTFGFILTHQRNAISPIKDYFDPNHIHNRIIEHTSWNILSVWLKDDKKDTIDTKSQRRNFSIFENINQENTSEHAIHVFNKEKMFEVKCHNDFIKIYS